MGILIEFWDNNEERRRMRVAIQDIKSLLTLTVKPEISAKLAERLDQYTARLERLENPLLKLKNSKG